MPTCSPNCLTEIGKTYREVPFVLLNRRWVDHPHSQTCPPKTYTRSHHYQVGQSLSFHLLTLKNHLLHADLGRLDVVPDHRQDTLSLPFSYTFIVFSFNKSERYL